MTTPANRRAAVFAVGHAMAALDKLELDQALILVVGTMLAPLLKRLPPDERDVTVDALLLLANVPIPLADA